MSVEICLPKVSSAGSENLFTPYGKEDRRVSYDGKNSFQMLFEGAIAKDSTFLAEEEDSEGNKKLNSDISITGWAVNTATPSVTNLDMAAFIAANPNIGASATNSGSAVSIAANPDMAAPDAINAGTAASIAAAQGVAFQDMAVAAASVTHYMDPGMAQRDATAQSMAVQDVRAASTSGIQVKGISHCDMSISNPSAFSGSSPEITGSPSDFAIMNSGLSAADKANEGLPYGCQLAGDERNIENPISERIENSEEPAGTRREITKPNYVQTPIPAMNISNEEGVYPASSKDIEPYSQIANEIQINLEKKGPTEFRMQLEPRNLGEIDVKMRIKEGKLIIDIAASDPKTQGLLSGQVDKLVMNMGLRNVLVEKVQIDNLADMRQADKAGQGIFTNVEMGYSSEKQHDHSGQHWESRRNNIKIFDFGTGSGEPNILDMPQHSKINGTDSARMNYTI